VVVLVAGISITAGLVRDVDELEGEVASVLVLDVTDEVDSVELFKMYHKRTLISVTIAIEINAKFSLI